MSYENPTALRIGMTGTLSGWRVRVAGRVVLGMEEGGGVFYWNEFNLVDGSGGAATLIYEETESGADWKLFKVFEPLRPLTADVAALKRVGQMVDLDGIPTRISLVDQSRVYFIEGIAPEGVEVGDVANYFNAEDGRRMLVASWTGDEIEFFKGSPLPAEQVAAAFGLDPGSMGFRNRSSDLLRGTGPSPAVLKGVGVMLALFGLFAAFSAFSSSRSYERSAPPPPAPRAVPALQLANGARGTLGAHQYVVANRAMVAIGTVNGRFDRREYDLVAENGDHQLLVQGLTGEPREWHLFTRTDAPSEFSPYVAAAQRKGAAVRFGGKTVAVSELFQTSTLSAEGSDARASWPAGIRYGFVANAAGDVFFARWDESGLQLFRGSKFAEAEVVAALGKKSGDVK